MSIKLSDCNLTLRERIQKQIAAEDNAGRKIPHAKSERLNARTLVKRAGGEKEMLERVRVSFALFRVKSLDPDNAAGSVKHCLDFVRRVGLIEGDENWRIKLEVEQFKVKHYADEKTEITIELK